MKLLEFFQDSHGSLSNKRLNATIVTWAGTTGFFCHGLGVMNFTETLLLAVIAMGLGLSAGTMWEPRPAPTPTKPAAPNADVPTPQP